MMWNWFNWGFGGFWWIMPIIMIVFWGLVIWGIVILVRRGSRSSCCSYEHPDSAIDILKRRYASGDITKEEFEEKKRAIA